LIPKEPQQIILQYLPEGLTKISRLDSNQLVQLTHRDWSAAEEGGQILQHFEHIGMVLNLFWTRLHHTGAVGDGHLVYVILC
jgi:hypothetical protein